MAIIKIVDQKDKDGIVIDQYATFREYSHTNTVLSKSKIEKKIAELREELDLFNEVLAKFTI